MFSHKRNIKVAGVVYLHRISDNRLSGAALKNLHAFASLCGPDAMPGVILVTTMWDDVKEEVGVRRETELKDIFSQEVMDVQCGMERCRNTSESVWDIVNKAMGDGQGNTLLLQEEMGDGKSLGETSAFNEGLPQWLADLKEVVSSTNIFQ
jgi:hypothetical protein